MDEGTKRYYMGDYCGKPGAERNPASYQRRDDGNHFYRSDEYYEWWYVDAGFKNGYHMVATFHYMNMFLNPIVPSVQIMIYRPDGTKVNKFSLIKPEENYAGADWCDVRMGDNWLKDRGNGIYEMYMMIKGVGARLKMKNIVPGWKLGLGTRYRNEETGDMAGWVVPVPCGIVEGELYLNGETVKVSGDVYHDHNWGNYAMHKWCRSWYWGRVHGKKYSIDYVYHYTNPDDAPRIGEIMIARGTEIILSSTMIDACLEHMAKDEKLGQEYANRLTITGNAVGIDFKLTVGADRIFEGMQLPQTVEWKQYYWRFLADYSLDITIDGIRDKEEGKLMNEYMLLKP